MIHRRQRGRSALIYVMAVALTVTLGACGGGGGGGGGSEAPVSRASMIPVAPVPGALLYADATPLRPISDGARWSYHGTHTPANSAAEAYDNVVTQAAQSAGLALEANSNLFADGASSVQVQVATGIVGSTVFDYSGNALPALATELRSPVRAGDQTTIVEQTVADSGFDVDGDGKHDAVDYAIYRRVIGNEALAPPSLGTVTALRVDTVFLFRFIASSSQAVSPVTQFVQSVWYMPGIGIVRQSLSVPDASGVNETWDELLTNYDAQTHGAGVNATIPAVAPQDGSANAGLAIPGLIDALRIGDHVVARTGQPGQPWSGGGNNAWPGMYFAVIDQRGQVQALRDYSTLTYYGQWTMLPAGSGFAEVSPPDTSGSGRFFLFDGQATLISPTAGINYSINNPAQLSSQTINAAVASDGNGFWVVAQRSFVNVGVGFLYEVVARHFDYAGQPIGNEVVLADPVSSSLSYAFPRVAVTGNRIAAAWVRDGVSYSSVWTEGETRPVAQIVPFAQSGMALQPIALPATSSFAAQWSITGTSSTVGGILLDANGAAVLPAGVAAADGELLSSAWGSSVAAFDIEAGTLAGQVLAAGAVRGTLWPTDRTPAPLLFVADYRAASGPLSGVTPRFVRMAGGADFTRLLPFDDRYVLLSGTLGRLAATVIWR